MACSSDISDLTREQLIANLLRYKIDLIKHLTNGTFAIHPQEVLEGLEKCLSVPSSSKTKT
jgi:hypothetical protein